MRRSWLLMMVFMMAGCAAKTPPATVLMSPPPDPPHMAEILAEMSASARAPVGRTLTSGEFTRLMDSEPAWPQERPVQAIAKATRRATVSPITPAFQGAVVVYPYRPGSIYRIDVAFTGTTHVVLQPDEKILQCGGLRPTDWIIQPPCTSDGILSDLLLTPKEANLRGRFTLLTTKGAYYMDVRSHEHVGLTAVSWAHPAPPKSSTGVMRAGEYGIGYEIVVESGQPLWAPVYAWDHGGKMFIQASAQMRETQAPVLYARVGEQQQLVNYRLRGTVFQVDRLAPAFEMRLGHGRGAEVVLLRRAPVYRKVRCPGSEGCPSGALMAGDAP